MSFFSDLFEGNFGNLGKDIVDAPSSLVNHPDELAETLGGAALIAAPFVLPEIGAGLGITGAADAAVSEGGLATDLGIADIGGAAAADTAAGAADLFPAVGGDALSFAPEFAGDAAVGGSLDSLAPFSTGGDFLSPGAADATPFADTATAADTASGIDPLSDTAFSQTAPPSASGGVGATPVGGGATTTPSGFASTDAELSGAATGTAPAATSASGGGFTSTLSSALSSPWTKLALGVAPLALTLGMGETQLPAAAQQLQGQALQLQQTGLTDLANARAGVLNAGQTAQLGQMRTDLLNQWRQTLANQGVQDITKDTRYPQILALIDSQVTQQTAAMIQQNITNALAETGQASQALTSIAQMQFQADQNFTNALISATKSLGLAAGGSSLPKITIG